MMAEFQLAADSPSLCHNLLKDLINQKHLIKAFPSMLLSDKATHKYQSAAIQAVA